MTQDPTTIAEDLSDLIDFVDASPTPYHAVATAAALLDHAGFTSLDPLEDWGPEAAGPAYVVRDGALVAWCPGRRSDPAAPLRMIGAHTDSPGLRVRPRPDRSTAGWRQLGVELYGGALRNSWVDRDLGLAGRVAVRRDDAVELRRFRTDGAVMRVPQLAIHLDRDVNTTGLVLNAQQHLTPVWGLGDVSDGDFRAWLAALVGVEASAVVAWEALAYDVQPSAVIGAERDMLAAPRLDDLAGCWAALTAVRHAASVMDPPELPTVVVLNDHEEVGSQTATGADGAWVEQVLERRVAALGGTRTDLLRSLTGSLLVSVDMAHATHPNYPERHEPGHWIRPGGGPVIKHNVNARYATESTGAAAFRAACDRAGVPVQEYSHRGDLPCGSTIGPITASRLAVDTVDVGAPMLSMHSARELMAVADITSLPTALQAI